MASLLSDWPTWPLIATILLMMFAANEIGFRLGNARRGQEPEPSRTVSNALKASIFGLVAFLLGFSFSMTATRQDARRKVVLNEANALGTCYLRAGLWEGDMASGMQSTLREYTKTRLDYYQESLDHAALAQNSEKMDRLMQDLWKSVGQMVKSDPQMVRTAQIVPAANAVIDLHSTRAWVVKNHLPAPVLFVLIISVLVSSLLIGHSSGQSHRRHLSLWFAFNLLFTLVLFVVLDFDRPRRGLVQVDHSPLQELLTSMQADSAASPAE